MPKNRIRSRMPKLTVMLLVRIVGIFLLLVLMHTAAAIGTVLVHGIISPDGGYVNYGDPHYRDRIIAIIVAGAMVIFAIRATFYLGNSSHF